MRKRERENGCEDVNRGWWFPSSLFCFLPANRGGEGRDFCATLGGRRGAGPVAACQAWPRSPAVGGGDE